MSEKVSTVVTGFLTRVMLAGAILSLGLSTGASVSQGSEVGVSTVDLSGGSETEGGVISEIQVSILGVAVVGGVVGAEVVGGLGEWTSERGDRVAHVLRGFCAMAQCESPHINRHTGVEGEMCGMPVRRIVPNQPGMEGGLRYGVPTFAQAEVAGIQRPRQSGGLVAEAKKMGDGRASPSSGGRG